MLKTLIYNEAFTVRRDFDLENGCTGDRLSIEVVQITERFDLVCACISVNQVTE